MIEIDMDRCIGCGKCVKDCFPNDIVMVEGKAKINNIACMKCGHCIAVCPKNAITMDDYDMDEVKNYSREKMDINADNLLNFIKFRRTIRQFKKRDVEEEKILKIIEAGRFTQTGSNLQDVSYIVVRKDLQLLKEMTLETLKQVGERIVTSPTSETTSYKRYALMWIKMYEDYKEDPIVNDRLFFNAPAVIVVTANSDISGGLASSNMELMVNALGLGTLFSGFFIRATQNSEKIKEFLGVEDGKHIVSCMVIGYPDVKYLRTVPRKNPSISWK